MRRAAFFAIALLLLTAPVSLAQKVPDTYKGYVCTKDCSGHKAGYAWAAKKGITDINACGGTSSSFVEGCRSWVLEQAEDRAEPAEDDDEDDQDFVSAPE